MKALLHSFLVVLFITFFISSCSQPEPSHDGYIITGKAHNYPEGTKVQLQKVIGRQVIPIDTATLNADGTFEMKGKIDDKCFAQIVVDRNRAFVILDNETINLDIDKNNARTYKLSGNREINQLQDLTDKVTTGTLDNKFLANYADTVYSPYLAYMAMQYLKPETDMPVFEKVDNRFKTEAPNSEIGKQLSQFVQQIKTKIENEKKAGALTAMGTVAPDINLPNPDGKNMKLSDLKGKYVLLDFWASWCGPCRRENPNVVRLYDKYRSKGFEVFSVSLDSKADRWKAAIEKDNLKWPYHVSDLQKWNSAPAGLYGVRSIPSTFLIDKEGKIMAKNLRGAQLESKLAEIFN